MPYGKSILPRFVNGLQRASRQTVFAVARMKSCLRYDARAYSEHDGSNRQLELRRCDTRVLYVTMNRSAKRDGVERRRPAEVPTGVSSVAAISATEFTSPYFLFVLNYERRPKLVI